MRIKLASVFFGARGTLFSYKSKKLSLVLPFRNFISSTLRWIVVEIQEPQQITNGCGDKKIQNQK